MTTSRFTPGSKLTDHDLGATKASGARRAVKLETERGRLDTLILSPKLE
jgi:hypothetical protein